MEEGNVLDEENWRTEAESVINDVKNHVHSIAISENIKSTNKCIILNIQTLEKQKYCVELSSLGFRVVGNDIDDVSLDSNEYFETPYSLLSKISSQYLCSFSNALTEKLTALQDNME